MHHLKIALVVVLAALLERGQLLDGLSHLIVGGFDPHFSRLLPEHHGVPDVVGGDLAHGAGVLGQGDHHIQHSQGAAHLKHAPDGVVLGGLYVAVVNRGDVLGTQPVETRPRPPIQNHKGDDDKERESNQHGLLKAAQ